MLSKMRLSLVSALLATEATALVVAHHRHGHRGLHKRDLVYQHTEVVVETEWVTVTVYDGDSTSATPTPAPSVFKAVAPKPVTTSSSSAAPPPPPPAPPAPPAPTTSSSSPPPPPPPAPATSVAAQDVEVNAIHNKPAPAPAPTTAAAQPAPAPVQPQPQPAAPAASQPASGSGGSTDNSGSGGSGGSAPSGGNKRGLAYNNPKFTAPFLASGNKVSWSYNWAQSNDGPTDIEFVPMLWGPIDMHTKTWNANAERALQNGAKNLLSFNECDNGGQCNKSPAEAAAGHIKYMNPFAGRAAISSPAITNSNLAGEGISWLKAWVQACNGNCKFDFCAAHWYSPPDPKDLLNHLDQVHDACQGKPVWLTEFAPISGDRAAFLSAVMKELDTNPKYSYVQRYSYFMVDVGGDKLLDSPTALNAVGKAFAFQ